jgi:hypothetical protein
MKMSVSTETIRAKYYPVSILAYEMYGYVLSSPTLSRWVSRPNKAGKTLNAVKLGGVWKCTEADLVEYVSAKKEHPQREPLTSVKAPSPEARAKRIEKAKAELEAAGI